MPENGNEGIQQNQNQVSAGDLSATQAGDLEAIEALSAQQAGQLKEEKKARVALGEVLSETKELLAARDVRIAELESSLSEVQTQSEAKAKELEASAAELVTIKEALSATQAGREQALSTAQAGVAKYLEVAKAFNPSIPEGIISGETIEEIDQSIEKGKAIVEAVKTAMESEAAATKVPAGAPTRGGISLEGLSPKEKIAYGITQGSQR